MVKWRLLCALVVAPLTNWSPASAQETDESILAPADEGGDGEAAGSSGGAALAEQLANPIANLISVPLQFNYDCCYGPDDGDRLTLNVQPVIPLSVSQDWNLITRTIVPIITAGETVDGAGGHTDFGDVVQSFFLSPKKSANGLTWGVGPVFLWPTGGSAFSARKFGVGPTAVALKQSKGITYGVLANHIWSFAGNNHASDVSASFVQPFITKTLPDSTSFALNVEATYDWKGDNWSVPINLVASHVYAFGNQPVSLGIGGRYYAASPQGGPEWGGRLIMTFLFPK